MKCSEFSNSVASQLKLQHSMRIKDAVRRRKVIKGKRRGGHLLLLSSALGEVAVDGPGSRDGLILDLSEGALL